MPNKLHTDVRKTLYDYIGWSDYMKDSTDLEAATKTISRTSEASGVGNADYSYAAALSAAPVFSGVATTWEAVLMTVVRIATRVAVTIDSDDGTHDLRCRVYVDAQDSDHLLFDLTYSATGAQAAVQPCLVGSKDIIFNLLKDGATHTFYFFFWSPGNHSPVISLCQVQWGIGSSGTSNAQCMRVSLKGAGSLRLRLDCSAIGTTNYVRYQTPLNSTSYYDLTGAAGSGSVVYTYLTAVYIPYIGDAVITTTAQTATDIFCLGALTICLIREE